jgi:hypothetical protein
MHQVRKDYGRPGHRNRKLACLSLTAVLAAVVVAMLAGFSATAAVAIAGARAESAAWGLLPSSTTRAPRAQSSVFGSLAADSVSSQSTATTAPPKTTKTTVPPTTTTTTAPAKSTTTTTAPAKSTTTTTTGPKPSPSTTTTTAAAAAKAVPPTTTTTTIAPRDAAPTTTTTTPPPPGPAVTPPPLPAAIPTDCSVDVSAALTARLDALPSGAVFTAPAGACYQVDEGLEITHPLTLNGGTFEDDSSLTTVGLSHFRPIIEIDDTSQVTIKHVSLEGGNLNGRYHPDLVNEAGIKVVSSSNVTLDDVTVANTFGDGLELVADLGHDIYTPDTDLTVNGYTTTNAGRQGITLAEVRYAVLTNINIVHPDFDGFDFESDIQGLGAGNVAISDCTYDHGINIVEPLKGPLSVTDCSGTLAAYLMTSGQTITFSGGSLECAVVAPIACIHEFGGTVILSHMAITRDPHRAWEVPTTPAWHVVHGGHLELIGTTVVGPTGSADSGSKVTTSK